MTVKCPENVLLKTYLREQGYTLNTACGGRGNCGKCVVRVIEGDVPVNTMDRMWFTEEQLRILIRHELHHVGIEYTDLGLKYYIVPHDVEEFWEIIHDHGLEWSEVNAARGQPE